MKPVWRAIINVNRSIVKRKEAPPQQPAARTIFYTDATPNRIAIVVKPKDKEWAWGKKISPRWQYHAELLAVLVCHFVAPKYAEKNIDPLSLVRQLKRPKASERKAHQAKLGGRVREFGGQIHKKLQRHTTRYCFPDVS